MVLPSVGPFLQLPSLLSCKCKDKLRRHCPKESAHGIDKLEDMMMCLMNEFVWLQASKVLEAAIQEAESQKRALYQQAVNAEMMLKTVRNRGTP